MWSRCTVCRLGLLENWLGQVLLLQESFGRQGLEIVKLCQGVEIRSGKGARGSHASCQVGVSCQGVAAPCRPLKIKLSRVHHREADLEGKMKEGNFSVFSPCLAQGREYSWGLERLDWEPGPPADVLRARPRSRDPRDPRTGLRRGQEAAGLRSRARGHNCSGLHCPHGGSSCILLDHFQSEVRKLDGHGY